MASSIGGLKTVQWLIRSVQFACAAITLAIYSYFLAALHQHALPTPDRVRAVEGISGVAALYALTGLVLLCCVAGHAATSFIAVLLDLVFAAAFVYVAVANRGGAGSCRGVVDTPFGQGEAENRVGKGGKGIMSLPSFGTACRMQTVVLAVAIIAIFFFVFSVGLEVALVRNRRKSARYDPSLQHVQLYPKRQGPVSRLLSRRRNNAPAVVGGDDPNALPRHAQPDQLAAHDAYAKYDTGYGHGHHHRPHIPHHDAHKGAAAHHYRYDDGVYDRT